MSSNYTERSIYKIININNDNILINDKLIINGDLKLKKNIITSNNSIINSRNLELLNRPISNEIIFNKPVLYDDKGQIRVNELVLNKILFGNNILSLPEEKGNNGEFLSICKNNKLKWTKPNKGGINCLDSLDDVKIAGTNIIIGRNNITSWLPNNNNQLDLGSNLNRIKDIYCRRVLTNDVDVTSNLGRASIGYCGKHDFATFSHFDSNNINSYALGQTNFGETFVNSSKNKNLNLSINNFPEIILTPSSNINIGTNYSLAKVSIEGGNNNNFNCKNKTDFSLYSESNIVTNGSLYLPSEKRLIINSENINKDEGINFINKLNFSKNEKKEYTIQIPDDYDNFVKAKQFIPNINEFGRFYKRGKNFIIDLYQSFEVSSLICFKNSHGKDQYHKLKLKKSNGNSIIVNILRTEGLKRLFIDFDLTIHCDNKYDINNRIINDYRSTVNNNYIFVYGQEVDDFKYYNQSQLSILNSIALKNLIEINQNNEKKINDISEENQLLKERLVKIEGVLKSVDRFLKK